jgi:hypothetical protein
MLGVPDLSSGPRERVQSLWYAISEELQVMMEEGQDPDILRDRLIGFQDSLVNEGWTYKKPRPADLKTLLREFLALGGLSETDLPDVVRRFVLRWGPLWCCMEHQDCCWGPVSYSYNWYSYERGCRWFCSEPLVLFQAKARQAEAAIIIADYLSNDLLAPTSYWHALGVQSFRTILDPTSRSSNDSEAVEIKNQLATQSHHLMQFINRMLGAPQGPAFGLVWSRLQKRPLLVFDTGLGFLRLVWLLLAQSLAGGKGVFRCDNCSSYFVPTENPRWGKITSALYVEALRSWDPRHFTREEKEKAKER